VLWHKASEAKASNLRQLSGEQRKCMEGRPLAAFDANDPSPTLAVHCGSGFDARFEPYHSTHLSRYNAGP
jgi:hypothetical protein